MTYLDCGAYTPLLNASYKVGLNGLNRKYHPWTIINSETPTEMETLRGLFGKLINAQPDDIAIINSSPNGVAVIANNISVESSQEIVIIIDQFPSNVFGWRYLANQKGAKIKVVPRPRNGDWTSNVLENIGANTAIAALPPCHWSDGTRLDLITIGAKCRKVGAVLSVDATQTLGAMVMDMTNVPTEATEVQYPKNFAHGVGCFYMGQ